MISIACFTRSYHPVNTPKDLEDRTGHVYREASSKVKEEPVIAKRDNIPQITPENNKVDVPMPHDVQIEHHKVLPDNLQNNEDIDLTAFDFSADLTSVSGKRKVFQRNMAAICTLKRLEEENRGLCRMNIFCSRAIPALVASRKYLTNIIRRGQMNIKRFAMHSRMKSFLPLAPPH